MATHRRLVKNEGPDFYVTPPWGTRALLLHEKFRGTILEPCCGNGAMAEVLKETGNRVVASDLYARGYGRRRDFFSITKPVDNIVTNPPFNIAEDMIEHALKLARRKVAFLLRTAFVESAGRYWKFYDTRPPSRLLIFSKRLSIYPANDDRTEGGTTSYCWFIWNRAQRNRVTLRELDQTVMNILSMSGSDAFVIAKQKKNSTWKIFQARPGQNRTEAWTNALDTVRGFTKKEFVDSGWVCRRIFLEKEESS